MQRATWIGIAACVIATIALTLVSFNMLTQDSKIEAVVSDHSMGGMGGMSGGMGGMSGGMGGMSGGMGGMSGGMGGMSGGMGGMSGGMDHSMTSSVQEVCHPASGMPPHYCEPTYQTMSSVAGIKISKVEPVSNTEVKVTIKDSTATKVSQKIVLVGGSGYLSGATVIEDGWEKSKVIHLKLDGTGTIYDFSEMHLHLFPHTEK